MSSLAVCRACLSPDVLIYPAPREYVNKFEKLTNIVVHPADEKLLGLCNICCYYLWKYNKFREICLRADGILNLKCRNTDTSGGSKELLLKDLNSILTYSTVQTVDIPVPLPAIEIKVKKEITEDNATEVEVKEEIHDDNNDSDNLNVADDYYIGKDLGSLNAYAQDLKPSMHGLLEADDERSQIKINYNSDDNEVDSGENDAQMNNLYLLYNTTIPLKVVLHKLNLEKLEKLENGSYVADIPTISKLSEKKQTKYVLLKKPATNEQYPCQFCDRRFHSKQGLNIHLRVHSEEASYYGESSLNEEKLPSKTSLILNQNTGKIPYQCLLCTKMFLSRKNLKQHQTYHKSEKRYECSVCKKKFGTKCHLIQHLGAHASEKPFNCLMCNKTFSFKQNLLKHKKLHENKQYECSVCQKTFRRNDYLKVHLKTHSGVKQYQCAICHKKFGIKNNLMFHLKIHTGEKPFQCEVCGKCFGRRDNYNYHVQSHSRDSLTLTNE